MRSLLFLSILFLIPLSARAETAEFTQSKPAEIASTIQAKAPYSEGSYDYYVMRVYEASLWTDAPHWTMGAPFALSLHYEIDIPKETMVEHLVEEMDKLNPLSSEQSEKYKALLDKLYPEIKDGDVVTTLYVPGEKLSLYQNGILIGSSEDMVFARHFMDIWFSPRTSAEDLRHQLLRETAEN